MKALRITKSPDRLKQQLVDAETGETVEKDDIGRGYEIGKGQYLQIEDEEIKKIRIESSHTITIDAFVPRSEIDDRYIDDPYYRAHRPGRTRGICRHPRCDPRKGDASILWMHYGRVLAPRQRRSPPQQARKPEPVQAGPPKRKDGTLKPKCEPDATSLEGGIIAFTGRLASMKRADAFALVTKHGGKPRQGITNIPGS